jgi:glycosyltransferase involved in cell wall biosynthesis
MRVLYLFPRPSGPDAQEVRAGLAPSDRLYGMIELARYGHTVAAADSRFGGAGAGLIRWARRRNVYLCDLQTLRDARRHDVIVAKDDFSEMLTAGAHLVRRPIVYVDALFQPPRRPWKMAAIRAHIAASDGVVVYSETQKQLWIDRHRVNGARLAVLPYTVDIDFYRPVAPPPPAPRPYVLSVGRDMGRHFPTLVAAMDGLGLDLKLVTRPYLLSGVNVQQPWIELRENVPYQELFGLYAGALMAVVPLKAGLSYPSGIRGLLETLALGCPAVATRTPVLEEYLQDGDGVRYVPGEDVDALRAAIRALADDAEGRAAMARRGQAIVRERYHMDAFGRGLERYLESLL